MPEKELAQIAPSPDITYDHVPLRDGTNMVFIAGASGAGKNSTIRAIVNFKFAPWHFSVSYTTRKPRDGERDGIDYHFRDNDRFCALRDADAFIECAKVHGNLYGTPLEPLERALDNGKIVIGDIDVQGVARMRKRFPNAAFIFLSVNRKELESRLRQRGDTSDVDIVIRLNNSEQEASGAQRIFDPESFVSSITTYERGYVSTEGIELTARAVMHAICLHAKQKWRVTPPLLELYKRMRFVR